METVSIGVDIVDIRKIGQYKDSFYKKVFTAREISECKKSNPEQHFAGKFAAKEAVSKCFGCKIRALEIEIVCDDGGKPTVNIICNESTKKYYDPNKHKILVSISHDGDYAVAYAHLCL